MATTKKTSTAVAVKKTNVVSLAAMQEKLRADVAALAGRTAPPSGDMIRFDGKMFVLPDGNKVPGPLDLVLVDFLSYYNFYEGAYDKDNIVPPTCFALGLEPTSLVPSDNSPEKQASACSSCPMNQFGSAGKGKACTNNRLIAVLPPDADVDTPIWIMKVSPTALKAFDGYVTQVARQFNLPPIGVVTEVSFDENVAYPSLRFGNPRPNANLADHFPRKEEAMTRLMTEPDVSQAAAPAPRKAVGSARRR